LENKPLRLALITLSIALGLGGAALAQPPAPAAPATPTAAPVPKTKFGPESTFKELLENPAAKKIIYEQIPLIMAVFDMGLFPDIATLQIVADDPNAQSGGGFTPEVYRKLLADLAKL
jgi:hypothetical protein